MRTPSFSVLTQALFLVSSVAAASCVPGSSFSPGEEPSATDEPVAATVAAETGGATYAVYLNGVGTPSLAKSMTGGGAAAKLATDSPASPKIVKKQIDNVDVDYETVTLETSFTPDTPITDWVKTTWGSPGTLRTIEIRAKGPNGTSIRTLTLQNAKIIETRLPALSKSSSDSGLITVKVDAKKIVREQPGAQVGTGPLKSFKLSNFDLDISGLDTSKVQRIEPIVVKTPSAANVDFPTITLVLPEADADEWVEWFEDFVVAGNNSDSKEKEGTLALLDVNMKPVAHIDLYGIGIRRVAPTPIASAPNPAVASVTVELYVEQMKMNFMQ
jgi:hypothetical protein